MQTLTLDKNNIEMEPLLKANQIDVVTLPAKA